MRTELDDIVGYGINVVKRRIYLGVEGDSDSFSDITSQSVELVIRVLHKLVDDDSTKPIELHISSPGGDSYAALRLYDEIQSCPCQVKFIGGGLIASAATLIMVGCDERILHPNSTVMVHDGSDGIEGTHTDVQVTVKESARLQDIYDNIYTINTRMPESFWKDVLQRDLYLTAEEAITLGLADKLVQPIKRSSVRRSRTAILAKKPNEAAMKKLVNSLYTRINRRKVPKIELNAVEEENPVQLSEPGSESIRTNDQPCGHGGR